MKEALLGTIVGLLIFLAIIGVNVTPFILFALILGAVFFFLQNQGSIRFEELLGGNIKRPRYARFEDIGGQDSAIKELQEALQFILRPDEIGKMGIRPIKGILLVGPPGTGKTLLARAAAGFTSSIFIAASGSEFIEMYAGVGAKRVRQLFRDARGKANKAKKKSAIIFIDELEILGVKRGSNSSHMEYDQTLNQLLVEMDGISQNEEPRVLIIAASNRADMLDPALLRPGRFDRQVQVGLPDKRGRAKILNIHTRNKPLDDELALEDIARATFGFSGAHLESLANEAAIMAMREKSPKIEIRHFEEAIDKVIMGEKLDRKPSPRDMERVSIHESGHALISELLQPGSVSSLTIVPRGAALGFMRKSAQEDQYLYTREELEKQIMIMLAGALAEELCFGSRSTGARNDFAQAWDLLRDIIDAGLSSLGVVKAEDIPPFLFYRESKTIIKDLEGKTSTLLQENINSLKNLAACLLDEESLDRRRLSELLNLSEIAS